VAASKGKVVQEWGYIGKRESEAGKFAGEELKR